MTSDRSGDRLSFWDATRDSADRALSGAGDPVAFSKDGQTLATAERDQIKLWHIPSGTELITLRGDVRNIKSLAFSPDGHVLAAGYSDGRIGLRHAATDDDVEGALHDAAEEAARVEIRRPNPPQRCERD